MSLTTEQRQRFVAHFSRNPNQLPQFVQLALSKSGSAAQISHEDLAHILFEITFGHGESFDGPAAAIVETLNALQAIYLIEAIVAYEAKNNKAVFLRGNKMTFALIRKIYEKTNDNLILRWQNEHFQFDSTQHAELIKNLIDYLYDNKTQISPVQKFVCHAAYVQARAQNWENPEKIIGNFYNNRFVSGELLRRYSNQPNADRATVERFLEFTKALLAALRDTSVQSQQSSVIQKWNEFCVWITRSAANYDEVSREAQQKLNLHMQHPKPIDAQAAQEISDIVGKLISGEHIESLQALAVPLTTVATESTPLNRAYTLSWTDRCLRKETLYESSVALLAFALTVAAFTVNPVAKHIGTGKLVNDMVNSGWDSENAKGILILCLGLPIAAAAFLITMAINNYRNRPQAAPLPTASLRTQYGTAGASEQYDELRRSLQTPAVTSNVTTNDADGSKDLEQGRKHGKNRAASQ